MVRRRKVIDRGSETMLLYPEVVRLNHRGEREKIPSDTPITIRVNAMTDQQSEAEIIGDVTVKALRLVAPAGLPTGTWARLVFRGEEWDMQRPPTESRFTRATSHTEFFVKSRNKVVAE